MDEIPNKPGIYMLINKINGKIYVGKAKDIKRRMYKYKSVIKQARENYPIVSSIRKYGLENFDIEILHQFDDYTDNNILLALETAFIDFYDTTNKEIGYNVLRFNTDWTGHHHTEESKEKMRKNLNRIRNGEKNGRYGKKMSPEHLNKFIKGRIEKISIQVKQIDVITNEIIKIWFSLSDASRAITNQYCIVPDIIRTCQGLVRTCKNFAWQYATRKEYEQFKKENPHLYDNTDEGIIIKNNNSEHERNPGPDLSSTILKA